MPKILIMSGMIVSMIILAGSSIFLVYVYFYRLFHMIPGDLSIWDAFFSTTVVLIFSCFPASMALGCACIALECMTCYRFCDDGLYIKYLFEKWKCMPWESFQQICICYPYGAKDYPKVDTIICFVKQGEKKSLFGRWKTENPFHYRSVISFPLEPEILDKLQRKCTVRIDDLRGTGNYRHPENVRHDIRLKTPEELRKTE